jgi:hypothetical protein
MVDAIGHGGSVFVNTIIADDEGEIDLPRDAERPEIVRIVKVPVAAQLRQLLSDSAQRDLYAGQRNRVAGLCVRRGRGAQPHAQDNERLVVRKRRGQRFQNAARVEHAERIEHGAIDRTVSRAGEWTGQPYTAVPDQHCPVYREQRKLRPE